MSMRAPSNPEFRVTLPPPESFGLPAKFDRWRPYQAEAIVRAAETTKRFVGMVAPTGFGKSPVAITIARLVGGRACYLTETKPLANQLGKDFSALVTDVRGRGNYDCIKLNEYGVHGPQGRCDRAESMCMTCPLQEKGCNYFDRWRDALRKELPLTNYSYWFAINEHNEQGIGKFDLLICDEGHSCASALSSYLKIEISAQDYGKLARRDLPKPKDLTPEKWRSWAVSQLATLKPRLDRLKEQSQFGGELGADKQREMRELAGLCRSLEKLGGISADWKECRDWREPLKGVSFEPIWPGPYSETLFQGIKKVVLMSATLVRKDLEKLGISQDEVEWLEYPSSFPIAHRPVMHVPTVQMRATMSDAQKLESVRRADQIIRARSDRKGIVHTVSYERAKHFHAYSEHRDIVMLGESRTTQTVLDRFMEAPPPRVLVGPSYYTGYDFPGESAEYQILLKIPFLDTRAEIEKARQDDDEEYSAYCAMKAIVQAAGRINRSATDSGETFIIDDQWLWFRWKFAKFAPRYFLEACSFAKNIPAPLPKLKLKGGE